MLIIVKIGKIEKEEISKNYFNIMAKTRIALIQMKMSSDQKKNMSSAIKRIREACKKKSKGYMFTRIIFIKLFLSARKTL